MKHQSFDSSPLAWSSFPGKHATTDLSGVRGGGGQVAFMYLWLLWIYVVFEVKNAFVCIPIFFWGQLLHICDFPILVAFLYLRCH